MTIGSAIRPYGDPILREITAPVEHFDSTLEDLGHALVVATMRSVGHAVAAPQIGESLSVFYWRQRYGGPGGLVVNPTLSDHRGSWMFREGCLSIPNRFWWIDRPAEVTMTYFDAAGTKHVRSDDDFLGRLWQHEVDHLDGRLVVDRLSKSQRKKFERENRENPQKFERAVPFNNRETR